MASADVNPRFALVNESDVVDIIDEADSKHTKRQIKYATKILSDYAVAMGSSLADVEAMSQSDLDAYLCKFYVGLRKVDGTLYCKKSMHGIRFGLQRHFQSILGCDVVKDAEFKESCKVFKAVLVKLKKEGLGLVKHKNTISQEDFSRIQGSPVVDQNTPRGLQNKVFIDIMLFLCNRGQENLRSMKPGDFSIEVDDEGSSYIQRRDQLTKNNRENVDEAIGGRMYAIPGDKQCPVQAFLKYSSKLHPDCPDFWQTPKEKVPTGDQPWYCNGPVGQNTLAKKMKVISTSAGCSKVYTNHCLRATCVTVLDRSGFENRDIMSVSGHHSEQSIKHYSKTSDSKMREMSNAIARKIMPSTSTVSRPTPPSTQSKIVESLDITEPSSASNSRPGESSTAAIQELPGPSEYLLTLSQQEEIMRDLANSPPIVGRDLNFGVKSNRASTFNFHNCIVHMHNT